MDVEVLNAMKKLVPYLEIFEAEDFEFADGGARFVEQADGSKYIEPPNYSREALAFFDDMQPVMDSQYEPGEARQISERVDTASMPEIRRLLTAITRSERFGEGMWLAAYESGAITAALRRLKVLLDEGKTQ